MMVVQSTFGSCFAICCINPSFKTLNVPFSSSEIAFSILVLFVTAFLTVLGACGVGGVTFVAGGEVAGACESQGAADGVCAAWSAGLLKRFVDGVNDVCFCAVAGGSSRDIRSKRLLPWFAAGVSFSLVVIDESVFCWLKSDVEGAKVVF